MEKMKSGRLLFLKIDYICSLTISYVYLVCFVYYQSAPIFNSLLLLSSLHLPKGSSPIFMKSFCFLWLTLAGWSVGPWIQNCPSELDRLIYWIHTWRQWLPVPKDSTNNQMFSKQRQGVSLSQSMRGYWQSQSGADQLPAEAAAVLSRLHWLCHAPKIAFSISSP